LKPGFRPPCAPSSIAREHLRLETVPAPAIDGRAAGEDCHLRHLRTISKNLDRLAPAPRIFGHEMLNIVQVGKELRTLTWPE